jgi:hypothetical protein
MSDEPIQQFDERIHRFVYGKLGFDEDDTTFFCDFYRELCAASGERFTQLAKEIGDMCVEKLLAGDEEFFSAVAKTLKLWPPDIAKTRQFVSMPAWASAWRFFNKVAKSVEYVAKPETHPLYPNRTIYRKEIKRGNFTRDDLSEFIYQDAGIRPSSSLLTDMLDFFERKAEKQSPPGRPPRRKHQRAKK